EKIHNQLVSYNLVSDFSIAVSDNASTDDTMTILHQMKTHWGESVRLDVLHNETNVGLEQNTVNLLKFASADYIIWLGDDDFLPEGYLQFVKEQFASQKLGWMIPGLIGVDKEGKQITGRPIIFPYQKFAAGYSTTYEWSHLAHQMSGLVVKREGLYEQYTAKPEWRNPYLFIFFTAWCQMYYDGIYAPSYQALINNYNPKAWGYNKIGLLDEVFKSYYYLKASIGTEKLNKLLLRFIVMHSYRIDFDKGFSYLMQQGRWIGKSAITTKTLQL
ncbi:MAG: hypothetical protein C4330_14110, partial [Chitinophagaceae bacterium]